jgi:uridine kinase
MSVEFSASTWRQPMPPWPGPARAEVIDHVVALIDAAGAGQLRIAVDGFTAAGKTSFGHELARRLHRPVLRALC